PSGPGSPAESIPCACRPAAPSVPYVSPPRRDSSYLSDSADAEKSSVRWAAHRAIRPLKIRSMATMADLDEIALSLPQVRKELSDVVVEAWLTRAQKRVAKAWLAEQGVSEDDR